MNLKLKNCKIGLLIERLLALHITQKLAYPFVNLFICRWWKTHLSPIPRHISTYTKDQQLFQIVPLASRAGVLHVFVVQIENAYAQFLDLVSLRVLVVVFRCKDKKFSEIINVKNCRWKKNIQLVFHFKRVCDINGRSCFWAGGVHVSH